MSFNAITGKDEPDVDILAPAPAPEHDVAGFLDAIQKIESSGGKNFDHPTMKAGIHAGDTAIGRYGFMPNTVREIGVRAKRAGEMNPDMEAVASMADPSEMKAYLEQNPEIEQMFAEQLAKRLLKKFPNEEQAAYSWNQGHNLSPESLAKRDYVNHDYVKKFNQLRKLLVAGKE